jgi:NADP-dependent 3-hydroxy acid dehydrogenase YdfG
MDMSVKQENPVASVTGAASGIGKATALEFAKSGYKVFLVDCNEERLEWVAKLSGGDYVY